VSHASGQSFEREATESFDIGHPDAGPSGVNWTVYVTTEHP